MRCKHGTYVGTPHGADHICGKCEDGDEPVETGVNEDTRIAVEQARVLICNALPAGTGARREAVKTLAEGFGFVVADPDAEALKQAAAELGVDL